MGIFKHVLLNNYYILKIAFKININKIVVTSLQLLNNYGFTKRQV